MPLTLPIVSPPEMTKPTQVLLAAPRGFCAGVDRAIDAVNQVLQVVPPPVYVFHEIVHNAHVVRDLGSRGAIFVNDVGEVPDGSVLIFSAHGIAPQVRKAARERSLRVVDATCPLVTKVHLEAIRYAKEGRTILLVGHAGHDEVVGTVGEAPDRIVLVQSQEEAEAIQVPDPDKVAVITQTTLAVDDTKDILDTIRRRFPSASLPARDDICYATQNRQMAVKDLAGRADLVLVVGSDNSSNSIRLVEVSRAMGTPSYLIDDVSHLKQEWLDGVKVVGITAGASAPEKLVQELVDHVRAMGARRVENGAVVEESVHFELPSELEYALTARNEAS